MTENEDEEDKSQQQAIKMRQLVMSNIERSHRSYVTDIQFVPGTVKFVKPLPNEGKSFHFISVSEDGQVMVWDSRDCEISKLKQ